MELLDPWPQVSDAVVDYYFRPKLAFQYLVRVQEPVCMMAAEAHGWTRDVILANGGTLAADISWTIRSVMQDSGRGRGAHHANAIHGSFDRYRDRYLPQLSALVPAFDPEMWR